MSAFEMALRLGAGVVILLVCVLVFRVQYEEMEAKYRARGGK